MSVADDLISDARNYASGAIGAGVSAMNSAIDVLNGLGQTVGGPTFPSLTITPPAPGNPGDVPVYTGVHFTPDDFTGIEPILQQVPTLTLPPDPGNVPAVLPYNEPIAPSGEPDPPSLLNDVPTLTSDFAFPTMPDLEGEIQRIVAPEIIAITLPDAPVYAAPEFTGVAPVFNAEMPTDLDDTFRTNYATISPVMASAVGTQLDAFMLAKFPGFAAGMAAIEARLATYLAGGSALSPAIENALYNRTLGKTNADARRASQDAWGKAARGGFTVPSPILLSQQQDIDQARRVANAMAAAEIAIKQAELEQSNLQFAVTKSSDLRKIALDAGMAYYTGLVSVNGQAIDYARGIVDAMVKAFDIAARYAETQARIYEADATVYRAKLEVTDYICTKQLDLLLEPGIGKSIEITLQY